MIWWLVEEHMNYRSLRGTEKITRHWLVRGENYVQAFVEAAIVAGESLDEWPFSFWPNDLEEVGSGYMWQVVDASSLSYEVRKVGTIDNQQGWLVLLA
jgi:hypothetical protein